MSDRTITTPDASLVGRMRRAANQGQLPLPYGNSLMHEAADEIERLREQLEAELKWRRDNDGE